MRLFAGYEDEKREKLERKAKGSTEVRYCQALSRECGKCGIVDMRVCGS